MREELEVTTRQLVRIKGEEFKVAESNYQKAILSDSEDSAEFAKIKEVRKLAKEKFDAATQLLKEEDARNNAATAQSIVFGATPAEKETIALGSALQSLAKGEAFSQDVKQVLTTSDSGTGKVYLSHNLSKKIVTTPGEDNPFSDVFDTSINEEWVSLLNVTADDIAFIQDGEIAKEIEAVGDSRQFTHNLIRLFIDISAMTLELSDVSNLEGEIINKLREALNHKFYHVLINETPSIKEKHMSLLANTDLVNYEGADLAKAIKKAKYAFNQNIRKKAVAAVSEEAYDAYVDSQTIATGIDWSLKTPEKVLGVSKVIFADEFDSKFLVFIPEYAKYNLNSAPFIETEKSVKYGMVTYAISADFDFQILLNSMFKTATIVTTP